MEEERTLYLLLSRGVYTLFEEEQEDMLQVSELFKFSLIPGFQGQILRLINVNQRYN